jgi:hypothetical protein
MNKKTSKVIVGMIFIAGLWLTQCRQEPASVVVTPVVTPTPTQTPIPTATPTEGEKAAEAAAQQFVPEYFPSEGECHQAVAEGIVTECMYQSSIQSVIRPEWEQLFPEVEFYFIRLDAYHPEDDHGSFSSRNKLVARQNDQQFEATSFDKLLAANNISITDENHELVAQAFALMTLDELINEEVTFTLWEPIDIQNGNRHYIASLQAWTKLGGLEIEWSFGSRGQNPNIATGPWVFDSDSGDYIPLSENNYPNLNTSTIYNLGGE